MANDDFELITSMPIDFVTSTSLECPRYWNMKFLVECESDKAHIVTGKLCERWWSSYELFETWEALGVCGTLMHIFLNKSYIPAAWTWFRQFFLTCKLFWAYQENM